jgi:hypothetical protein
VLRQPRRLPDKTESASGVPRAGPGARAGNRANSSIHETSHVSVDHLEASIVKRAAEGYRLSTPVASEFGTSLR